MKLNSEAPVISGILHQGFPSNDRLIFVVIQVSTELEDYNKGIFGSGR